MILKSISYFENKNKDNYWEIKDVNFSKQNLIVGLNATGKTRLTNIITSLASILSAKVKKLNGNWFLTFENGNNIIYTFNLQINEGKIECEEIKKNDKLLLDRKKESGKIYSKIENNFHHFNPPVDELTLNVRRDIADYPFLEDFIKWAKNLKKYSFSGVKNDQITIPNIPEGYIDTLTTVPYILKQAGDDKEIIEKILKDMNSIGYPIEKVFAKAQLIQPSLNNIFTVAVKETNLKCETEQATISNGMFRALCLIVIVEYLLKIEKTGTIIIDDLGEGLDFDRSTKLTKLLFQKTKDSDLQLIITSNDRFLINSVDIRNINYLERKGHVVQAYNYNNNKDVFDRFLLSGLNNFDFLNPSLSHLKN
ncbi:MAG: ATP-binding protein [Bacteroidales bacterium]|jgi:predicted ATPase|nr:ATP-binding protein [Bacteroidales bacterium]